MTRVTGNAVAWLLVATVALASLAPAGAAAVAATDSTAASSASGSADALAANDPSTRPRDAGAPGGFAVQQVDADDVLMAVALRSDGDAAWTVEYRVRLRTDNETEAFRSLIADVEDDPGNFTDRFGDRMRGVAAAAENATGREMAVRNVSVDAAIRELPSTYGVLTYTFEWTNFAAVDGRELRAGTALSGLFLDERTRLVVSWPAPYERQRTSPDPTATDDRSVTWQGPVEFEADQPRLVLREPGPLSGLLSGPLAMVALGGLALVVLALVVVRYRRRLPTPSPAGGDGDAAAAAGGGSDPANEPPDELLSNEERVLQFVEQRGGRVKQQEIVEALDWTEAKTSQVVNDLREDDRLEGFRLGRENVLRLPDVDDSPSPGIDDGEDG